ncbi:GGDEF domain-containing protein [Methylobacterium terrae]|nr:GGDEF domain-containing protein [Methylobacterium terrae]
MDTIYLISKLMVGVVVALAIVPLRDVARLANTPAVKRGWHALNAGCVICIVLLVILTMSMPPKTLDLNTVVELIMYFVGAAVIAAFAHLARRTGLDLIRLAPFEVQAFTDGLTGLGNRRLFTERLDEEIARARDTGLPLSLIVLDIDHFKRVNDTYGHAIGDVVLKHVANAVMAGMRNADTVCRIGGEEIAAIMPRIDPAQAAAMADALRVAIGATAVPVGDGRTIAATVSLGFATWKPGEDGDDLFGRADAALYAAKHAGRDRISLAA